MNCNLAICYMKGSFTRTFGSTTPLARRKSRIYSSHFTAQICPYFILYSFSSPVFQRLHPSPFWSPQVWNVTTSTTITAFMSPYYLQCNHKLKVFQGEWSGKKKWPSTVGIRVGLENTSIQYEGTMWFRMRPGLILNHMIPSHIHT
jgi:hypothetical protein